MKALDFRHFSTLGKHDATFIAHMDRHMPNWREIRKELNDSRLDYYEAQDESPLQKLIDQSRYDDIRDAAIAYIQEDHSDGVIMEDKLGFSLIYMQAKEWAPDRVVGQPDIQSFVGAIAGKHGDGLFVTTAKFSQKAKDYANTHHIILIDGERLANLMIEYNFCVSTRKTFEIKAIDTDALAEYQDE